MKRAILLLTICLLGAEAYAQTIADIARRERDRRANSPEAGTGTVISSRGPLTLTATRATAPGDIGAEPEDVLKFYDVHGSTAAALRADVAKLGPTSAGVKSQAVTNSSVTWRAITVPVPGGKCGVTDVDLKVTIEILLPRWVDEAGAPESLSVGWRNFLTGLLGHEHGHKRITLDSIQEIRQLAKNSPPQANCDAATATFNTAVKAINQKADAKQDAYDKETDHGRLQGVRLP